MACEKEDVIVEGMSPVYISSTDFTRVYRTDTLPFNDLGNIVLAGKFLFINEKYEGIHVIDNSDPFKPRKVHFWKIPGNLEFIINGKTLYADNSVHLLVIDITDFNNIKVVNFIKTFISTVLSKSQGLSDIKVCFPALIKKWNTYRMGEKITG